MSFGKHLLYLLYVFIVGGVTLLADALHLHEAAHRVMDNFAWGANIRSFYDAWIFNDIGLFIVFWFLLWCLVAPIYYAGWHARGASSPSSSTQHTPT